MRFLLVFFLFVTSFATSACRQEERWNLLLVTFDTTRADHIACYGNESISTPNVDQLAANGVLFRNATTAIPLTLPSHTSIMTGKNPVSHGVRDNGIFVVDPRERTLAEILSEHGWACGAAIGSYPLVKKFGLDQGFGLYDDHLTGEYEDYLGRMIRPKEALYFDERKAARVNEAVLPWIEENRDRPFFLWVHYFDPHQPLNPPPPYDQMYANDLYDGEIAYSDESFGSLLDELRRLGVYDHTVIVFTSDHGEGLGEHGEQTHSMLLYQGTLHVPLVISAPGGRSNIVDERVGLVDIAPTVLDLLGVPSPEGIQGRSLAPQILGAPRDASQGTRELYAETLSPRLTNGWGELRALFSGDYKYIHGPRPELFDLAADPRELRNLVDEDPQLSNEIRERLAELIGSWPTPGGGTAVAIDDETRQKLAALGYFHSTDAGSETIDEVLLDGGIAPQDRVGDVNDISTAKNLLYKQRPLEAREILLKLVERNPENPMYRELLATTEIQLGLVEGAFAQIEAARQSGAAGSVTGALVSQLAAELFTRGDRDQALQLLEDLLQRQPTGDGYYLHSLLLAEVGDESGRITAIRKALEVEAEHVGAKLDLAIHLAQTGCREEAETEFRSALHIARYSAKAHYNFGAFLIEEGELAKAVEYFERAVDLRPQYLKAHLALLVSRIDLGDQQGAQTACDDLVEIAPQSPEARQAAALLEGTS